MSKIVRGVARMGAGWAVCAEVPVGEREELFLLLGGGVLAWAIEHVRGGI